MDPRGFTVGRYPVHAVLGAGGFGTVYLGTDPGTGRPVAVKVLDRAAADPVQRGQLRAEADAMRRVNDPHCVRVLDVIDEAARAAIVTEFIEGASLRAVLDRAGRLTGPQALVVLRGALRGLVAVHAAGLIHGDLKPDNILVDQHGVSKLIDFGLAAAPQAPSQVRDSVVGSPSYLSPEQIRGAPADVRTDIYACAVMLFELLCGRRPYHADSVPAVLARHLNAPVPDPRSIVPDIGEALADLCRAGLAKDPAARPPTALAFLRALEDAARQRYGAAWAAGGAIGALMGTGFAVGAQQLAAKPVPAFGPARIARLVRPAHRGTRLALAGGTVATVAGVVVAVTIVAGGHSSPQAAASPTPTPTPSPTTISPPSGGGPTEVNPGYTAYRNGRFMYSVEVPRILTEQPPPEDRSGQDWTDGRAVLTTFGENNVLHDTPASALTEKVHEVQQSGGRVSSRSSNGTSWTCSGVTASGAVFDEKQFVRSRAEYAISWTYPAADASRYQPLVQHTLAAFIPGPNRTG